ncbi:MAG: MerR family transcriptional regulator [Ascidiaceihabitans sp.]|nr:MerR family transcriptional regulator [Ascidiaceihabitans sp.]
MTKSADAFRTISEVADWLGVQTHVLRFWESKFTQVKPVKRAGGRRYYRPADMQLLGGIQKLLHEDGLTIKGVQKILREKGMAHVSALSPPVDGGEVEQMVVEPEAAITMEAEPQTATILPLVPKAKVEEPTERLSLTEDETTSEVEIASEESITETVETTTLKDGVFDATAEIETVTPVVVDVVNITKPEELQTSSVDGNFEEPSKAIEDEPAVQEPAEALPESPEIEERLIPEPVVEETSDSVEQTEEVSVVDPEPALELAPEEPVADDIDPLPVMPAFLSRSTAEPSVSAPNQPVPVVEQHVEEQVEPQMAENEVEDAVVEAEVAVVLEIETTKQEAPAPLGTDLPEPQAEHEIQTSPRALAALSKVNVLTSEQAASIAPLLAQLRDARDRMTLGRKE